MRVWALYPLAGSYCAIANIIITSPATTTACARGALALGIGEGRDKCASINGQLIPRTHYAPAKFGVYSINGSKECTNTWIATQHELCFHHATKKRVRVQTLDASLT